MTATPFRLLAPDEFDRLSVGDMVLYQRELVASARQEEGMDWSTIQGRWDEYNVAAKRRWGKLSEQQLHSARGHRSYLLRRVQEAYSLTADEADRELVAWEEQLLAARRQ